MLKQYNSLDSGIFNGVWGTFPYFNSDKVIISDMDQGLFIVEYYNMIGDLNNDGILNVIDIVFHVGKLLN